ncbi:MAG: class I SAM-dependent methyltransferase [Caulobacteraceae bacterium]|nr:class I SAM-dependent methyltransferase [Caulobacteraceae bacterium]
MSVSPDPILAGAPSVMRTRGWGDYALLDSGGGRKLERYGPYTVVRPEPQCLWAPRLSPADWEGADAVFDPTDEDEAGRWRFKGQPKDTWPLSWRGVRFKGRFTAFRHLAFFPEQAANWAWLDETIGAASKAEPPRILNLFGYTGVASLVCAKAGATVTHVDASKKAIGWARENADLSGLSEHPIRWICEDARRYVQREVRRGSRYDGIILDPPKYGRGPNGEVWRLFEDLPELLAGCVALLSDKARFLVLNAYAERISGLSMAAVMGEAMTGRGGQVDWGELALMEDASPAPGAKTPAPFERGVGLSFFARWSAAA